MKSKEMQDKAMLRWYYMCVFVMPYMGWSWLLLLLLLLDGTGMFNPIVGCLLLPVELYLLILLNILLYYT